MKTYTAEELANVIKKHAQWRNDEGVGERIDGDYEFKGSTEYSQDILADVQRSLTKAQKALSDIDHNFAFVEGCELECIIVDKCREMLAAVSDNLYAVKK